MPMWLFVAHQGGWDEALIFIIPLALYAALRLYDRYQRDDEQDQNNEQDDNRPVRE